MEQSYLTLFGLFASYLASAGADDSSYGPDCPILQCPEYVNTKYVPVCFGSCYRREEFDSRCTFHNAKCTDPEKYQDYKQIGRVGVPCEDIEKTDEEKCCQFCTFIYSPSCWGNGRKQETFANDCAAESAMGCSPNKYRGWEKLSDGQCDPTCEDSNCPKTECEVCATNIDGTSVTFLNQCLLDYNIRCTPKFSGCQKVSDGPCPDEDCETIY